MIASYKKGQGSRKIHDNQVGRKKETQPEYSRRMEERRRLEGKQKMKSNL